MRRALNPRAQKERKYLRNRHGGSNAPFIDVSLAPVANAFAVFMAPFVAEYREAAAKRIHCGRRIQLRQLNAIGVSAHATDLCLPRDPGAIKSDISSGAVYRDSTKSASRQPVALIKTRP